MLIQGFWIKSIFRRAEIPPITIWRCLGIQNTKMEVVSEIPRTNLCERFPSFQFRSSPHCGSDMAVNRNEFCAILKIMLCNYSYILLVLRFVFVVPEIHVE